MNAFDRLLATLLALGWVAIGGLLVAVGLGWDPMLVLGAVGNYDPWPFLLAGAAIVVVATRVVVAAVPSRRPEPSIVRETALGQVRLSRRAIAALVQRTARQVPGVRDVDVDVWQAGDGIEVRVAAAVAPDYSIPELSSDLQERVEQYLRETAGLHVSSVAVEIRTISGEGRSRVE